MSLEQELKNLKLEFNRLRRLYLSGRLSQREYIAELKRLRVKDKEGKYWTIGARSGQWYYYNGFHWVRAEPPIKSFIPEETASERGEERFPFPGKKAEGERDEILSPLLISPEEASWDLNLSNESKKDQEKYIFFSLPLLTTSLFFGGIGLFFGLLIGAIVGSTQFFLASLKFLPPFLQEIMGKLTGGLILAALGGLTGFIAGSFIGLILSFAFNLTASFMGGLVIKGRTDKSEKD